MSGGEATEALSEEAEEPRQMNERTAKAIIFVIAAAVLWGLVVAFPWVAYVVVGVLGTLGWLRARAWITDHRSSRDDEPEEEQPDVVEALQHLGQRGDSVLLTRLRKHLRVADTKTVKALLKDEGIRVRTGVRTPAGNGPGVHHEDIPAPPPAVESGHGDGCCCRSEPTTPTPTTGPEEGLRVVPLGLEGKIVYDPKDTVRHHRVKKGYP
ncbi:hypothetical protein [Streptomyces griseorubiginosus]|uniref:hypothetical protein n=1 Tax=Streptomyces griseorubiginosus TaxID=67304 RepID=UPI0036E897EA